MGFIKKAMKGVSKADIKKADSSGGFRGLDAGDYVLEIIDVNIGKYREGTKNAGRDRLELEFKVKKNWDGEKVDPEVKLRTMVGLFSHWASGALNFTLFQFLKALEDGWDYDEDEALLEIEDEDDARSTLMGLKINASIGYRISEPNGDYPANVFNEIDRFLLPEADLGPNLSKGDYDSFKEKNLGTTTVNPARDSVKRDTDVQFKLK